MKKLVFTILLMFFYLLASAQSNFKNGYIVTLKGDTIHGFVKQQNEKLNSQTCVFKDGSGQIKTFQPGKIAAYSVEKGINYVSRFVLSNKNKSVSYIFAEYLVKGKKSLFYFRDNYGKHYLLSYKKDTLIQFPYLGYNSESETGSVSVSQVQKGFLKAYFKENLLLLSRFQHPGSVNLNDLIGLFENYNQLACGNHCYTVYYRVPSIKLAVEVQGSAEYVSLVQNNKFFPQYGALLYLRLLRISKGSAIKTGILYYKYPGGANSLYYPGFKLVTIPLQAEYGFFPDHRVDPKIDFGFNFLAQTYLGDPHPDILSAWAGGVGVYIDISKSIYLDLNVDSNLLLFPGAHFNTFSLNGGIYCKL